MLTLIMCLATVSALDSADINWKRALGWTTVITVGVAVAIGFMPQTHTDSETEEKTVEYGLYAYADRFWAYVAIALICIAVLFVLLRLWRKTAAALSGRAMCRSALFAWFIPCICSAWVNPTAMTLITTSFPT